METYCLSDAGIRAFACHLQQREKAPGTIEAYCRGVAAFARWLGGAPAQPGSAAAWKAHLADAGYAPATINCMLIALNCFFRFAGRPQFGARLLRVQRRAFRDARCELTRADYDRLLDAARRAGRKRLALLLETICATGIRVSELRYITCEAVRRGRAEISLKGKVRTILLPGRLCRKLEKFARRQRIAAGEIFRTKSGRGIGRRQVWAEMKALCRLAGVAASKVYPHNLRHLFARTFYRASHDIAMLADVLGHSSIDTTRIYLIATGAEHARQIDRLGLVT